VKRADAASATERILAASAGRDRVTDAVKALALALVVIAHNLAWTLLPDGGAVNTLEAAPRLFPLTWFLQILPLFFLLAGAGLRRHAAAASTPAIAKRVDRLVTPAVLLLLVTATLSAVLSRVAGASIGQFAGLLPMQLTWFLGVYLMIVAVSPMLFRMSRWWHFATMFVLIGLADMARVYISEGLGWVNLLLVWALFAALGMKIDLLRSLPRLWLGAGALICAALAVTAIVFGPYSAALVTTTACPGLSNLAPPTIVLALAGTAQICVLMLLWPALERALSSSRVWVGVALFSSRAMGIYLWHMIFLSVCVAIAMQLKLSPPALSAGWWALHLLVFAIVVTVVWFASPVLLRVSDSMVGVLSRPTPRGLVRGMGSLSPWITGVLAGCVGVVMALASESGLSDLLTQRNVIGLPYIPVVALGIIVGAAVICRAMGRFIGFARVESGKSG
jgi:fucose 4-O-acetylase-like acetyltransferase